MHQERCAEPTVPADRAGPWPAQHYRCPEAPAAPAEERRTELALLTGQVARPISRTWSGVDNGAFVLPPFCVLR
jgi:hypothetical protein